MLIISQALIEVIKHYYQIWCFLFSIRNLSISHTCSHSWRPHLVMLKCLLANQYGAAGAGSIAGSSRFIHIYTRSIGCVILGEQIYTCTSHRTRTINWEEPKINIRLTNCHCQCLVITKMASPSIQPASLCMYLCTYMYNCYTDQSCEGILNTV